MSDVRSRRRMASAAGISLLLHLAVIGALSLIGPHFAAEPAAGNESNANGTRITIHAPQDASGTGATEPVSSRPSPDATPNPVSSRAITERTTSLPEGNWEPHADPEARRTTQIASRETASPIRPRERAARPFPGNTAARFSRDAVPRRSRAAGERSAPRQTDNSGVSRSELIRTLYNELEEAFHYPAIARRRSLEGSVELLVEVALDGELRSLTIEQSSGSRILDEAAAETVTRLFPRPHAQRAAHELHLRVHYELN